MDRWAWQPTVLLLGIWVVSTLWFLFALKMQIKIICCPVGKSCLTLCNPMVTPGFPVLHYLPEFAQIHVHWVSDDTYRKKKETKNPAQQNQCKYTTFNLIDISYQNFIANIIFNDEILKIFSSYSPVRYTNLLSLLLLNTAGGLNHHSMTIITTNGFKNWKQNCHYLQMIWLPMWRDENP